MFTCMQHPPNAKNTFRSALGPCHLLENAGHPCVLQWTVLVYCSRAVKALSVRLTASALSVPPGFRVTPAAVWRAEHIVSGPCNRPWCQHTFLSHYSSLFSKGGDWLVEVSGLLQALLRFYGPCNPSALNRVVTWLRSDEGFIAIHQLGSHVWGVCVYTVS